MHLLQHSTAQHSTAQHSTAQHSTAQHSTAQHSTAQHSTAQHSTAQHSTAQHSTAQHSTAQHSTAQHSTAQHSTAQHSTAQHSTAQHSMCFSTAQLKQQVQSAPIPEAKAAAQLQILLDQPEASSSTPGNQPDATAAAPAVPGVSIARRLLVSLRSWGQKRSRSRSGD